jgi:hypothetical protein
LVIVTPIPVATTIKLSAKASTLVLNALRASRSEQERLALNAL